MLRDTADRAADTLDPVKFERPSSSARAREIPLEVLTDAAAALTYYTVLSLFPGIALLISAFALIWGTGGADSVLEITAEVAPESVTATLAEPIESVGADKGLSGLALVLSIALALFSASRYVTAFARAADRIQGREPGQEPFWRRRPLAMLLVAVIIILLPLTLLALLITGPIAVAVANAVGISATSRQVFEILRWPLLGFVGVSALTILYLSSAGMRRAGPRQALPGALVAVGLWLVASGVFSAVVANLTSFNLAYGSLAGFVVFLLWLYVSNLAVLAGMVVNVVRLGMTRPAAAGNEGPVSAGAVSRVVPEPTEEKQE